MKIKLNSSTKEYVEIKKDPVTRKILMITKVQKGNDTYVFITVELTDEQSVAVATELMNLSTKI